MCVTALTNPETLHAHRTEPIELINFDVIGSRGLCYECRRSRHLLLTLLSFDRLFIGVVLLLSPNEDLVLDWVVSSAEGGAKISAPPEHGAVPLNQGIGP